MSSICEEQLHSTAETLLEFVEALSILTQALPGVREREAAAHGHEIVAVVAQLSTQGLQQSLREPGKAHAPRCAIRHDEFGGTRGRGCAQVRDEICNREIDFVTDTCDDRHRHGAYQARNRLVIEGPEVFDGAASAGDDQYVTFVS